MKIYFNLACRVRYQYVLDRFMPNQLLGVHKGSLRIRFVSRMQACLATRFDCSNSDNLIISIYHNTSVAYSRCPKRWREGKNACVNGRIDKPALPFAKGHGRLKSPRDCLQYGRVLQVFLREQRTSQVPLPYWSLTGREAVPVCVSKDTWSQPKLGSRQIHNHHTRSSFSSSSPGNGT